VSAWASAVSPNNGIRNAVTAARKSLFMTDPLSKLLRFSHHILRPKLQMVHAHRLNLLRWAGQICSGQVWIVGMPSHGLSEVFTA
jgi:hypothetical protein